MFTLDKKNKAEFKKKISEMKLKEREVLLVLMGEECVFEYQEIADILNNNNITFVGGFFPAVIIENKKTKQGLIVVKLPVQREPLLIKNMERISKYKNQLEDMKKIIDRGAKNKTVFIIGDGHNDFLDDFLDEIFNFFANSVDYIGGAAGGAEPICIFNNQDSYRNAACVLLLDLYCQQGIKHGLQDVFNPLIATKIDRNVIKELNWDNPFKVYSEQVNAILAQEDKQQKLKKERFQDISRFFPVGIIRENQDKIIRDIWGVNEKGELLCGGKVPENGVLSLMKAEKKNLIEASGKAVEQISEKLEKKETAVKPKIILFIDCIARAQVLGADYNKAVQMIYEKNRLIGQQRVVGVLSMGEFSSAQKGFIEYYNMTTVVGALYE